MVLVTSNADNNKIYNLSGGRSRAADFLPRRKRRRRREAGGKEAAGPDAQDVELLQEFEFNVSSQCIRVSPDGKFIAATGVYPPEVRMYEVESMGLKFRRGLDHEVIDFLFLSEDYRKLFFLQAQRHIDIHTQGGTYHRLRIPREGRGLCYLPNLASACIAASGNEVYMLDLEDGCFLTPWTTASPSNNCCFTSTVLPVLAIGGETGVVECFDHRTTQSAASLDVASHVSPFGDEQVQVTCGAFSPSGLQMCVGTNTGSCLLYDLRSRRPLCHHSHYNGEPIKQVSWKPVGSPGNDQGTGPGGASHHSAPVSEDSAGPPSAVYEAERSASQGDLVLASCDAVSIHIWREGEDPRQGAADWGLSVSSSEICSSQGVRRNFRSKILSTIEAPVASVEEERGRSAPGGTEKQTGGIRDQRVATFNGFAFYESSGLCFTVGEQKRMGVYFLPALGIAPRWCSFLDTITEELEESGGISSSSAFTGTASGEVASSVYDDYRFVTRQQLEQMGVQELIGTSYVKRYMHGYFLDAKLHRKLQDALEPFGYEEYRREKVRQKVEENKKMRIEIRHKLPKANSALAKRLEESAVGRASGGTKKERQQQEAARQLLTDQRFQRLFSNPDFEIEGDEEQ
ncbi:putative embryo sac development arrest EDA7 [Toxoplasma gondii RUB]|uniref:Putative embryo sac development arrest EDA7 n=5 Tax=Toxoplasma gondii TaxID=5811 RepID=A0A2G8XPA8_TOXGO|nr:putative embryo sac development arrest EDA7 [Toxoplasma gondii p89]KFG57464.1 putative embryo sac development arrest EDA7 [Toxoplasma gondii RUB]KFH00341.1 putative embryo sac development arrest EDA7 [Toxoplasma gondii VAND]PIL96863.1 putative embryo sac development arrest EDA7 [Toxoplasma gondii COUG]PUA84329.1 putative embryo sac development arrest EDA7 [Toxoplasma gondii TgCATBr9]